MTEDKRRAIEYNYISKNIFSTPGLSLSSECKKMREQYHTSYLYGLTVDSVLAERVAASWKVLIENREYARKCLQDYLNFKKTITKENWTDEEIKRHYKFYKHCWTSASKDLKSAKAAYNLESRRYSYFRLWQFETGWYIKKLEDKVRSLEGEGLKTPKYSKKDLLNSLGVMSTGQNCSILIKCFDNLYHWLNVFYMPGGLAPGFYLDSDYQKYISIDNVEGIRYNGREWASRLSQEECDDILRDAKIE